MTDLLSGPTGWRLVGYGDAEYFVRGVPISGVSGSLLWLKDSTADPGWLRRLRQELGIK